MNTLARRVAALQARFELIGATRMRGLPMLHDVLKVQAVGFEPEASGQGALGVLVTPWFMNLVWLPLAPDAHAVAVGTSRTRTVGPERLDFIGAHEEGLGGFEACSLFSPMFEFVDQAAAVATAQQVLALLRPVVDAPELPSRRAWLTGRSGGASPGRAA